MNFSVEEENLICMYHTSDRRRTMVRMLAALPDMDTEVRLLANGTIAKLEHMTDADFDRNSRTRWPCGCCVRLFYLSQFFTFL